MREDEIIRQIDRRAAARQRHNQVLSEAIEKALASQGVFLHDRPNGETQWVQKR